VTGRRSNQLNYDPVDSLDVSLVLLAYVTNGCNRPDGASGPRAPVDAWRPRTMWPGPGSQRDSLQEATVRATRQRGG
jgi:hypothetical protein